MSFKSLILRNNRPKRKKIRLKLPSQFLKLIDFQTDLYEKNLDISDGIIEKIDQNCATLRKTQEILERTEDTVCNMLLAIRQNQFLQAYYPAQKDLPEMYVTGSYPKGTVNEKYKK